MSVAKVNDTQRHRQRTRATGDKSVCHQIKLLFCVAKTALFQNRGSLTKHTETLSSEINSRAEQVRSGLHQHKVVDRALGACTQCFKIVVSSFRRSSEMLH